MKAKMLFSILRSILNFLTTGSFLTHHVLFLFVVIIVYLISGFWTTHLLLLSYIFFYYILFIIEVPRQHDAQIKYVSTVNALEIAEVELFNSLALLKLYKKLFHGLTNLAAESELRTEHKRKTFSVCHTTKVRAVGFSMLFLDYSGSHCQTSLLFQSKW